MTKLLSHSQRATAHHLGMTEEEYLEHDRLIDLGRDTLLEIRAKLLAALGEMEVVGAALGDKRPGRFSKALDDVLVAVNDALRCGDCGVVPGQHHHSNCDVYRCKECGWQGWVCGEHDDNTTVWTGLWPGTLEEREYDLLDLNQVATFQAQGHLIWDRDKERLFRNPDVSAAEWDRVREAYVEREKKMSAQIFADAGWRL